MSDTIGRHLASFNLFRESDGSLAVTIAEARGVAAELNGSGAPLALCAMTALRTALNGKHHADVAGGEARETWASIAAWCEETFGPCGAHRMAERAMEEGTELLDETSGREEWTDKARIEVADLLICLSRVPGIWSAVEEKMAINRARIWNLRGDGTGYHAKASS